MTKRNDTPGIITCFAFHVCAYLRRIGAALSSASAHIFFGDPFPMLKPRTATLACPSITSVYYFYFHSSGEDKGLLRNLVRSWKPAKEPPC
ncbi:MAG: hypothetical protein ABJG47_14815 [Ekhidna sp.]